MLTQLEILYEKFVQHSWISLFPPLLCVSTSKEEMRENKNKTNPPPIIKMVPTIN